MKPWQGFNFSVQYFQEIFQKNPEAVFLVLTQERMHAQRVICDAGLCMDNVILVSLFPEQVDDVLKAADFGLLLRESHIVNWVSRPIKAMQYRANGLVIIHNMVVGWIIKNC